MNSLLVSGKAIPPLLIITELVLRSLLSLIRTFVVSRYISWLTDTWIDVTLLTILDYQFICGNNQSWADWDQRVSNIWVQNSWTLAKVTAGSTLAVQSLRGEVQLLVTELGYTNTHHNLHDNGGTQVRPHQVNSMLLLC